jgi:integrase
MPADQQGQVYRTTGGYGLRWYDENGVRRRKAGFSSASKARAWFRDVERPRMRGEVVVRPPVTLRDHADHYVVRDHADHYVAVYAKSADPNTIRVLRERLKRPLDAFGDVLLGDLEPMAGNIARWSTMLPERSRYGIMQAFRQTLEAAVSWGDITKNPAKLAGRNKPPEPRGADTFAPEEVERIAVELGPPYGPAIRFAAATGMRPEEWIALERQDIDRAACIARVARTRVEGRTKPYGKTAGSVREVPLTARALAALGEVPPRLDTRIVFPGPRGDFINLRNFRRREWHPALVAAGVRSRRIYDLRSTYASQSLAAGVSVFELADIMGTSVRMIERHYGKRLDGAGAASAAKLDAYLDRLGQEQATAAEGE